MPNKPFVIGITGQTGAGKTTLAAKGAAQGYPVLDADRLARQVVQPGSPCLAALAEAFSPAILREDGTLHREELARRAFSSPENAAKLNAITHPPILALMREWIAQQHAPVVLLDVPLLYESGADALCDAVIAVTAPADQRLARIMARDGLSEQAARARMKNQPEDRYYTEHGALLWRGDGEGRDPFLCSGFPK